MSHTDYIVKLAKSDPIDFDALEEAFRRDPPPEEVFLFLAGLPSGRQADAPLAVVERLEALTFGRPVTVHVTAFVLEPAVAPVGEQGKAALAAQVESLRSFTSKLAAVTGGRGTVVELTRPSADDAASGGAGPELEPLAVDLTKPIPTREFRQVEARWKSLLEADPLNDPQRAQLEAIAACPEPDVLVISVSPPPSKDDYREISVEEWQGSVDATMIGPIELMRMFAPGMAERGYGRIINTSSSQWRNPEGRANYGAAKGGIVSLTWALAFELRNHGITVNAIAPMGATRAFGDNTYREMLVEAGLDRIKDPAEQGDNRAAPEFVSPTVVYLASEQAEDINGVVFRVGSGKVGRYSHPPEMNSIHRDWRTEGPWPMDELVEILPNTLLAGETRAPFILPAKRSVQGGNS